MHFDSHMPYVKSIYLTLLLTYCCSYAIAQDAIEIGRGVNSNFVNRNKENDLNPDAYRYSFTGNYTYFKLYKAVSDRSRLSSTLEIKSYGWGLGIKSTWSGNGVGIRSPYANSLYFAVGFGIGYSYKLLATSNRKYALFTEVSVSLSKIVTDILLTDTGYNNTTSRTFSYPLYLQYDIPYQNTAIVPQVYIGVKQDLSIWKRLYVTLNTSLAIGFNKIIEDYVEVIPRPNSGDKYRYVAKMNGSGFIISGGLGFHPN